MLRVLQGFVNLCVSKDEVDVGQISEADLERIAYLRVWHRHCCPLRRACVSCACRVAVRRARCT